MLARWQLARIASRIGVASALLSTLAAMPAHGFAKKRIPVDVSPQAVSAADPKIVLSAQELASGGAALPLRITNRAQCAADALTPSRSALALIDGYDAGKLGHSLALATGGDPARGSVEAMRAFRLTATELVLRIMADLVQWRLPLLPVDPKLGPPGYREKIKLCQNGTYCTALDDLLASYWAFGHRENGGLTWLSVDQFNTDRGFFDRSGSEKIGCSYLKRFPALQAQLTQGQATKASLEALARETLDSSGTAESCFSETATLDSRYAVMQIDLLAFPDESAWSKRGFDFWNSVKIYFSWAWRNLPQLGRYAGAYDFAFRSIPVEETLLLLPSGCQSIEHPSCSGAYLSSESLRSFAQAAETADINRFVPKGPDRTLLTDGIPESKPDPLNFHDYASPSDWLKGFRERFTRTRGIAKQRFLSAITFLSVLRTKLPAPQLLTSLEAYLKEGAQEAEHSGHHDAWMNQLNYLCTEFNYAHNRRFSFLRQDLEMLARLKFMDGLASPLSGDEIKALYEYYVTVADGVGRVCSKLEASKFWTDPANPFDAKTEGHYSWFKEALGMKDLSPPPLEPYYPGEPLLAYKTYDTDWDPSHVICFSGVDCARRTLKAVVDLYGVGQYAQAVLPLAETISSPTLFNPYAERVACQTYDPWFKSRASFKTLLVDLGNVLAFGWNPLPIYVSTEVRPGEVTSFKRLVENGQVRFDPKLTPSKTDYGLGVDFGFLIGAPCIVTISQSSTIPIPPSFYVLQGISASTCISGQKVRMTVESAQATPKSSVDRGSSCMSCAINLAAVANVATFTPFGMAVKSGMYLAGAFVHYSNNMKDPNDVPHLGEINPNYLLETYRRFGNTIPDRCVKPLTRGKRCLANKCEESFARHVTTVYGGYLERVRISQGGARDFLVTAKLTSCGEEQQFLVETMGTSCEYDGGLEDVRLIRGPESCKPLPAREGS